jgi:hypothetical protein
MEFIGFCHWHPPMLVTIVGCFSYLDITSFDQRKTFKQILEI